MISAAERESMRRTVEGAFRHTYTRTRRTATVDDALTVGVDESTDAWGEQVYAPAAPESGLPCKYRERSAPVVTPEGLQVVTPAILQIPASDSLAPGDIVTNIRDAAGAVLEAGPALVEDINQKGMLAGAALHREAQLKSTTTV